MGVLFRSLYFWAVDVTFGISTLLRGDARSLHLELLGHGKKSGKRSGALRRKRTRGGGNKLMV